MNIQQSRTRLQIRTSIGRALGAIFGTATATGSTSTLVDDLRFKGGDDEHNGKMIQFNSGTNVTAGEQTWVADYTGATWTATLAPVVGSTVTGDTFEMWPRPFKPDDINDVIGRAIIEATTRSLVPKETLMNMIFGNQLEYEWLSGFKTLHLVEYVKSIGINTLLSDCETVWTAGSNVTASLDTSVKRTGDSSVKLVVAAGAVAGAILAYFPISEVDISGCDKIEFDMYSTIAQTANYLGFVLDDTAACVSPIETLGIPAMTAYKWYRHSLSLSTPNSDTAIISIGLVNTTDAGACTLWIDNVRAVNSLTKEFVELNPQYWDIVPASTRKLKIDSVAASIMGPTEVRLNGLQLPAIMTADTDTCEVDPEFVVSYSIAYLLLYHAHAKSFDVDDRKGVGELHLALSEKKKSQITNNIPDGTRVV